MTSALLICFGGGDPVNFETGKKLIENQNIVEDNPYQSPAANIGGQQSINTGDGVSAQTVDLLARTRPWALLVAILGFIGVAFMVLGSIIMLAGASSMGSMGTGPAGMLGAVFNFALAALCALPLIRLIQYSSAITQLRISPNTSTLEVAMDRQRSYWKTVGIMMLIGVVLFILLIVMSFVFASRAVSDGGYY